MFFTYVRAATGSLIEFERALLVMEGELVDAVIESSRSEAENCLSLDATAVAQSIWDDYCKRHREKFGESFAPDVIPDWQPPIKVPRSLPANPDAPIRVIAAIAIQLGFDISDEVHRSGRVPIFHTYVVAATGTVVDFDRAFFLMNRELLDEAMAALRHERDSVSESDIARDAQWVWEDYCQRHRDHYGTPFGPDIIPGWDHPSKPDSLARPQESMPVGLGRVFAQDRKPPP